MTEKSIQILSTVFLTQQSFALLILRYAAEPEAEIFGVTIESLIENFSAFSKQINEALCLLCQGDISQLSEMAGALGVLEEHEDKQYITWMVICHACHAKAPATSATRLLERLQQMLGIEGKLVRIANEHPTPQ